MHHGEIICILRCGLIQGYFLLPVYRWIVMVHNKYSDGLNNLLLLEAYSVHSSEFFFKPLKIGGASRLFIIIICLHAVQCILQP